MSSSTTVTSVTNVNVVVNTISGNNGNCEMPEVEKKDDILDKILRDFMNTVREDKTLPPLNRNTIMTYGALAFSATICLGDDFDARRRMTKKIFIIFVDETPEIPVIEKKALIGFIEGPQFDDFINITMKVSAGFVKILSNVLYSERDVDGDGINEQFMCCGLIQIGENSSSKNKVRRQNSKDDKKRNNDDKKRNKEEC